RARGGRHRGRGLQHRRQCALPHPRDHVAGLLQGVGDGLLRRLPDGPRGGARDGPARPRHHLLHRRHGQHARQRRLCRLRGGQACSAGAGPEHGARARAAGHPRRPRRHRRGHRHRVHPLELPRPLRPEGARRHPESRRHRIVAREMFVSTPWAGPGGAPTELRGPARWADEPRQTRGAPMPPTLQGVLIGFAVLFIAFRLLQLLRPPEKRLPVLRRGFWTDLVDGGFTPLVTRALTRVSVILAVVPVALLIYGRLDKELLLHGFGPASRLPVWQQAVVMLAIADFIGYWMHRWFHGRRLWRFHAVHHSSVDLDWLSAVRLHPVNDALMRIAGAVPL